MWLFDQIVRLRQRHNLKKQFKDYVPNHLLNELIDKKDTIDLATSETIGIVVTDISKYSLLCERLQNSDLLNYLNVYWEQINTEIENTQGILDKYIGDKCLILYQGQATSILDRMTTFSISIQNNKALIENDLSINIGMAFGKCVIGNMGSKIRKNYTAIGEPVNMAFSALSYAKESNIRSVFALAKEHTYNYHPELTQIGKWKLYNSTGV
jgi:adenylate cyclase